MNKLYLAYIVLLPVVRSFESKSEKCDKITDIEDPFLFLECNEKNFKLVEENKVVLVLGNTGSGKSTLVQLLTGDNDQLESVSEANNQFIIKDMNDKIGHGIKSKTLIPEKAIDPETSTVYYDCPGFQDTRNSAAEIAAEYFIKKTIHYSRSIKIVLTVVHAFVKIGVDRSGFIHLLMHASDLLKNIDKYRNSIILIVTKVEKETVTSGDYGEFERLLTDEEMIDNIAHYLLQLKQYLTAELAKSETNLLYTNALKFLNIFLKKDENRYVNIGIFRRPAKEGKLSELVWIQNGKRMIKSIVENNTIYTKTSSKDFGYTVSDRTKVDIWKWLDRYKKEFDANVNDIIELLVKMYNFKSTIWTSLVETRNYFTSEHSRVVDIARKTNMSSIYAFSHIFFDYVENLNINSQDILGLFRKQADHIYFLETVINDKFNFDPLLWMNHINRLVNHLEALKNWHLFLVNMPDNLSKYQFIKHIRHVLDSSENSVDNVLNSLYLQNFIGQETYHNISRIERTPEMNEYFMKLISPASKNQVFISCSEKELIARGDYIFISDLPNCSTSSQRIQIFCYNTLFLDADFSRVGTMSRMFVVAPKLIVFNNRAIMLNGIDGANQTDAPQGRNGEAGHSGISGGGFFGIVSDFSNLDNLVINVNGGNGGAGQAGGRGYDSKYQKKHLKLPGIKLEIDPDYDAIFHGFRFKVHEDFSFMFAVLYANKKWKIEVIDEGESGGDGFMPGPGGQGGSAGVVTMIFLSKISHVNVLSYPGRKGKNGSYGSGGKGSQGVNYTVGQKLHVVPPAIPLTNFWIESVETFQNSPGRDNFYINPHAIITRPISVVINNDEKLSFVMDCKLNLLRHMTEVVDSTNLINFYKQLSEFPDIDNMYDAMSFVLDLKNIESYSHKNHCIAIYDSLMKRIRSFSLKEISQADKKILIYIYTAALAQLARIKSPSENSLLHVKDYVEIIKKNYQSLDSEVIKYESAVAHKEQIENRINETKVLIDQITPQIPNIQKEIDESFQRTINEIMLLKKDHQTHTDEILEKRAEMEKILILSQKTDAFKVLASVISLFGEVGQILAEIITGASVVDSSISPIQINSHPKDIPSNAFSAVSETESIIANYFKSKVDAFNDVLQKMKIVIRKYPNALEDYFSRTPIMKYQNIDDIEVLNSFRAKLNNLVMNKQGKLEIEKIFKRSTDEPKSQPNNPEIITSLLNMYKTVTVAQTGANLYNKYKNDEVILNEIYDGLKSTESIEALTGFEIYGSSSLRPLLKRISTDMSDYNKNLETKSLEVLDVSRWKIQQHVQQMKQLLIKSTEFSEHDDLIDLVDELHETMNNMVNIYDQIQSYYNEKRLVDYLQVINSKALKDIDVENDKLLELLDLDSNIKTNLIQQQYQLALDAFKQLVFPFVHYFLSEYAIPEYVENGGDYLRNLILNKVNSLSIMLSEQRVNINVKADTFRREINFDQEPFYTWNSVRYSKILSNLFDGNEILLKADVFDANVKNALKFKNIGLNFVHIYNESLEVLNNYNIRMKHLGNSYYRCNDKYYVLTTESQAFEYSYRTDLSQVPLCKNAVYSKIEAGHFMLSPYTMWSVRLIDVQKKGYTMLQKLRGRVSVQLIGKGQYVSSESDVCEMNLSDHYEMVSNWNHKIPDV